MEQWNLIESDPVVFTEIFQRLGVKNVKVEELSSLEPEDLLEFQREGSQVYGLIFLFKWDSSISSDGIPIDSPDVYFAKQVIKDACATQAIVGILMNAAESVDIGPEMSAFRHNTLDLPAELKGMAIGQNELMRSVHNSFSPPSFFSFAKDSRRVEEDESFHFVCYVPHQRERGQVLEIDGLQQSALLHFPTNQDSAQVPWTTTALECIRRRIEKYQNGFLKFSLQAVCKDQREEWLNELQNPSTTKSSAELQLIQTNLQQAEEAHQNACVENEMRRTNFIPFMLEVLKDAASAGKLDKFLGSD